MKRFIIISAFFFSCMGKNRQEVKPVYDEVSLKTFVLSTRSTDASTKARQLDSILRDASNDSAVYHQTIGYLETPLSNPNSSYRNQNLYSKLLEAEMKSKWYGAYEKELAAGKLKLLQQNNVGSVANDFTYTTPAGYKKKMYDIKAGYLLLYFNNPECPACKEMKNAIEGSFLINQKIKNGELKILSVYTDKDEKLWLDHLKEYPENWLQGRDEDENLYKNKVYDLKAIPTVYLLDKNKKVLLKDCVDVGEIERIVK